MQGMDYVYAVWQEKSFSAAAVSDPDSATWMTYLSC